MTNEESRPLRVIIADDHALMRSGIRHALELSADMEVTAEVGDGLALLQRLEEELPDVVLLDLHMPKLDGLLCLERISARWPELPVLVLTIEEDRAVAGQALERGAAGYIIKAINPHDLAAMVRQAAQGNVLFGTGGLSPTARSVESPLDDLTDREREILGYLCTGLTNKDIARELFLTPKTVKYHLTHIFSKLGVSNRTEAATFAFKHGLSPDRS